MFKKILLAFLVVCFLSQSGCQLIPGRSHSKQEGPKKSIFGVHGNKKADFEKIASKDPFPSAESLGL